MMATRMDTEPIPAARRSSAVRVWLAVNHLLVQLIADACRPIRLQRRTRTDRSPGDPILRVDGSDGCQWHDRQA